MRFAAVHQLFLRTGPGARASGAALGAWTRLYARAAELEQGGKLPDAAGNDDRQWLIEAGLVRAEVDLAVAAGLCEWKGRHLVVHGYDLGGQKAIESARSNGRFGHLGGRPKARAHRDIAQETQTRADNPAGLRSETLLPLLSDPLRSDPDPYPKGSIQEISTSAELARRDSTPNDSASPIGSLGAEPESPPAPPVVTFDCVGKGAPRFPVTRAFVDETRPAYPAIDVELEIRQALIWTRANPTRRKTARGMPAFLVAWLARAQNRAAGSRRIDVPRETRCTWHLRDGTADKPSRFPSATCDRCKHLGAARAGRVGAPEAAVDVMPEWARAPPPPVPTPEQRAEIRAAIAAIARPKPAAGGTA